MNNDIALAREALRTALSLRIKLNKKLDSPICIFDFSEELQVPVRFITGKSFEGMYCKQSNTIMVPSERPPGRQRFACAHELGHCIFGHGSSIDLCREEAGDTPKSASEKLADHFAAHLLMPAKAVENAFSRRRWSQANCTPLQSYIIACNLGVGYDTLVTHMARTLKTISASHHAKLKKYTPKNIRSQVLPPEFDDPGHLIIADSTWNSSTPVDLQIGQIVMLPPNTTLSTKNLSIELQTERHCYAIAKSPGITIAGTPNTPWTTFIRTSRKNFSGLSIYRHLEETNDE